MNLADHELAAGRQFGEALARFVAVFTEALARDQQRHSSHVQTTGDLPSRRDGDRLAITLRDAAKLLAVSEKTLWSMTAPRGPIPAIRIGRRSVRYLVEDIRGTIALMRESGSEISRAWS